MKAIERPCDTYQVRCTQCQQLKWPYLPAKPLNYVCVLCRSGASETKRARGRKGGLANQALRRHQKLTEGQS